MNGTDPEMMCRRDREKDRHRCEILQAAERVFARKGYHAATIEEIAKEAEFAVGTLYKLFQGKDDLYTRVVEGIACQFMRRLEEQVLGIDDPEQAILALMELRFRHYEEHRAFLRIAFEASIGGRIGPVRNITPPIMEMHERYMQQVMAIFKRGIERGIFDQGDPLYMALCMEGIINAFVAYWSKHEPAESLEERIERIRRGFVERTKVKINASIAAAYPALQGWAGALKAASAGTERVAADAANQGKRSGGTNE